MTLSFHKRSPKFRKWYQEVLKEKKYYKLFDNTELNIDLLLEFYLAEKSPIETLNDLSEIT